jgi:hypothetical protein
MLRHYDEGDDVEGINADAGSDGGANQRAKVVKDTQQPHPPRKCWKSLCAGCAGGFPAGKFVCPRHRCVVEACRCEVAGGGGIHSTCRTCPRSCCGAHHRENRLGVRGGGGGGGGVGSAGKDIMHVICGTCREVMRHGG